MSALGRRQTVKSFVIFVLFSDHALAQPLIVVARLDNMVNGFDLALTVTINLATTACCSEIHPRFSNAVNGACDQLVTLLV